MMKSFLKKKITNQKGQALILGIFLVLATATTTVLLYNAGQTTSEKTRLVNAADAAAYSGAVYIARNLNYMAYTNRAMIANHVAIGHFVSYVSWIRYVKNSTRTLRNYTWMIPYVGQAVAYADKIMRYVVKGTERVAKPLVRSVGVINRILYESQRESKFTQVGVMSVSNLLNVKIMDKVGKAYDPDIRVNHKGDVNTVGGKIAAAQVLTDMAKVFQYTSSYKANSKKGELKKMVNISYDSSSKWIRGNRGWKVNLGLWKLEKTGNTTHTLNNNRANWNARDRLDYKWWTIKGWKSRNVAKGQASAREFDRNYKGIYGYYGLKNTGKNASQVLKVSALATMPVSKTRFMKLMGLEPGIDRLAALSRAEIFHMRPEKGYSKIGGKGEYANLYNPFWQVRLTDNQIKL